MLLEPVVALLCSLGAFWDPTWSPRGPHSVGLSGPSWGFLSIAVWDFVDVRLRMLLQLSGGRWWAREVCFSLPSRGAIGPSSGPSLALDSLHILS